MSGIKEIDHRLEEAIIELLQMRKRGSAIYSSEATRKVVGDKDWKNYLERTRQAARRLIHKNKILITQKGRVIDPSIVKGPIYLKLL